ncbi:MAG: choice-of-anchor B domain-containing protein [Crocinitomicaceae bacterium]|jgi:choice-of-anchor B domain-containing protein
MLRILFCLLIPICSSGQISKNITLLDHWTADTLATNSSGVRYNECFGFEQNGNEYVIAGSTEGTHFFQLTDDDHLNPVGYIEGRYVSSMVIHRDFAKFQNFIYAVCDEGESSLQIIDISGLPSSVYLVAENDSTFARVHNVFIDSDNSLLYACSITERIGGALQSPESMKVFSLADPLNPFLEFTGPSDIPEIHDAFVLDNIAYLNCGFDGLRVYDFSNPTSPLFIQNTSFYQDQGYNHQGWLSADGTTYIFGDETSGKQLKFCSVENNEVTIIGTFGTNSENNSVPHNIMISGHFAFVAYYNEGLRIYDTRTSPPIEIAHYDTYPTEEPLFKMKGAWGVHSDYSSGRVVVSDRVNGLFLVDFRSELFSAQFSGDLIIHPNPVLSGTLIRIQLSDHTIDAFSITIADYAGRKVIFEEVVAQSFIEVEHQLAVGVYTVRVQYTDYLGDQQFFDGKFIVY